MELDRSLDQFEKFRSGSRRRHAPGQVRHMGAVAGFTFFNDDDLFHVQLLCSSLINSLTFTGESVLEPSR